MAWQASAVLPLPSSASTTSAVTLRLLGPKLAAPVGKFVRRPDFQRALRFARKHEHLHARRLAIGRRARVGVVQAVGSVVLPFGEQSVALKAAATVVVVLGVTDLFVESRVVVVIVQPVVHEEQLGDRRHLLRVVCQSIFRGVVDVIEAFGPVSSARKSPVEKP